MAREVPPLTLLAALPVFQAVDGETLRQLAAAAERRVLERGDYLFRAGDMPTGMYAVVHGQIMLMAGGGRGRRLTGVVGPGRSLGEPVMFLERPALVDAIAATDALVLHLPRESVFDALERDPRFARRIIASLSARLEAMVQQREAHAVGSARARLLQYLLQRAAPQREGAAQFTLPAPKAAIAAQLHVTPEHFSRLLRDLTSEGLLKVERRQFSIPDLRRLADFSASAVSSRGGRTRGRSASGPPPA
jgi:CRP-like cAMP-binding protein